MATALEFYFNETRISESMDEIAYETYLTCTVDRTGKTGTKNFFVIAHLSTQISNTIYRGKVRLRQDGSTDLGECADGLDYSDTFGGDHGYTYNFVKRVSLDASSHSFTLDLCRPVEAGAGLIAENASIVVLEESANAEYNDSVATTGTGADTGWVDYLSLQFTAVASVKYLLIWSCEMMCEDESNTGIAGIQFLETEQALGTYASEGHGELVGTTNDNIYRTVGGVCFADLTATTQYTFKIQMQGEGVDDEIYCRKGAIIAIPFSDFENVYFDSQAAKTFHQIAQSNTNVVLAAQACNTADHLVIAGVEVSNESPGDAGFAHLISAGPVDFPAYNFDDRDEDAEEYYLNFMVHGVILSSGNYDFEIEGDSSSDSNEGCVNKAYLAVCEIPTVAPPAYIPKVIMVT